MPLPIRPQPSTPTLWMSAMNSSAPGLGPRPGILERLADLVGDPGECLGQRALAGRRADLPALEPIEHLLQRDVHALVRAAVGAGDHAPGERQADARDERQRLGQGERRSDEYG